MALLVAVMLGMLVPHTAVAGQAIDVNTLNPVPPDVYTCKATGSGTICTANVTFDVSGPTGVQCGDTANPVELLAVDATDTERLTRFYDANGDLTRRIVHETIESTWLNPATGLSVRSSQVAESIVSYSTPGDLTTGVNDFHGVVKWWGPGVGVVLIDVGHEILAPPDDTVVFSAGKHPLEQFFAGDTSVVARLCAALGSPGTPALP